VIQKRDVLIATLLFVFALSAYLIAFVWFPKVVVNNDTGNYMSTAREIARTGTFDNYYLWHYNLPFTELPHPMVERRPMLYLLMGAVYRLLPQYPFAFLTVNMVVCALTGSLTYLLGVTVFHSRRVGLLAMLLLFTSDQQWTCAMVAISEPLLQIFMCLTLFSLYRALVTTHPERYLLLAGLCGGLSWLARNPGSFMIVPIFLTVLVLWWRTRRKRFFAIGIAALAIFYLVNLPWQIWLAKQDVDFSQYKNTYYFGTSTIAWYTYNPQFSLDTLLQHSWGELAGFYLRTLFQKIDAASRYLTFPIFLGLGAALPRLWRHPLLMMWWFQFIPSVIVFTILVPAAGFIGEYYWLMPILVVFAAQGLLSGLKQLCLPWPRTQQAVTLLVLAVLLLYIQGQAVVAYRHARTEVRLAEDFYTEISGWLETVSDEDPVIIFQEPVSLNWYTEKKAILLPYGASHDDIADLARRFGARFLIHRGFTDGVSDLYDSDISNLSDARFILIHQFATPLSQAGYCRIFRIEL